MIHNFDTWRTQEESQLGYRIPTWVAKQRYADYLNANKVQGDVGNTLLIEWRRLLAIDARLEWHRRRAKGFLGILFGGELSTGERVAQYMTTQRVIIEQPHLLVDLLKSDSLSFEEKFSLYSMVGHGGSTARETNRQFWHVTALLREYRDDLPDGIVVSLGWQWRVCGW